MKIKIILPLSCKRLEIMKKWQGRQFIFLDFGLLTVTHGGLKTIIYIVWFYWGSSLVYASLSNPSEGFNQLSLLMFLLYCYLYSVTWWPGEHGGGQTNQNYLYCVRKMRDVWVISQFRCEFSSRYLYKLDLSDGIDVLLSSFLASGELLHSQAWKIMENLASL